MSCFCSLLSIHGQRLSQIYKKWFWVKVTPKDGAGHPSIEEPRRDNSIEDLEDASYFQQNMLGTFRRFSH